MSSSPPLRVLYVCHEGERFGSQQSLLLMVQHLPRDQVLPWVSVARPGSLNEALEGLPGVTLLTHRRLAWFKHDRRSALQRVGDIVGLLIAAVPRTLFLAGQIREHGIDRVHTNSVVSLEGALAARLAGVPHTWHIRELFMAESPKLQAVLGRWLTRKLVDTLSDQVICISRAVRDQFGPLADPDARTPKYRVIHNAVEAPDRELASRQNGLPQNDLPKKGRFRIGYVGRLTAGKRFQDLVEALTRLNREDIELWVAGRFVDEPFERRITEKIRGGGLADRVRFLGYQDNLAPIYDQLDLLVLPSGNEPFGRVVIEGMRAGVPCVCSNAGGIPEIVTDGETGLLYPPADVDALARTLEKALGDPDLLARIRQNALRTVRERFTMETQIDALLACYRSGMARRCG